MKYEVLFKSPSKYVFKDRETGELLFTGVFGQMGRAVLTMKLTKEESDSFLEKGSNYLTELRSRIDDDIQSFQSRFVNEIDLSPEAVAIINETSFSEAKRPSVIKRLLKAIF